MTRNERRLASIFLFTLVCAVLSLSIFSSYLRLKAVRSSEVSLRAAIKKIEEVEIDKIELRRRIEETRKRLQGNNENSKPLPLADFATYMKGLLSRSGLTTTKYQIINSANEECIEFTIRGSMLSFLSFLKEAGENNADFPFLTFRSVASTEDGDFVFRTCHVQ